ncbi:MAG: hypothetical protein V3T30_08815, partial [Thermodesulfobacteriota bacterium]
IYDPNDPNDNMPMNEVYNDFKDNYNEMHKDNRVFNDKFFHCKANCQSAQRGPGGEMAACVLSDAKEAFDVLTFSNTLKASRNDQVANRFGRTMGARYPTVPCRMICIFFYPK